MDSVNRSIGIRLDDDGFLGVGGDDLRIHLRKECADVFDVAAEVNRVMKLTKIEDWNDDERRVAGTGLFRKIHHDVQAVVINAERGLTAQALVLSRVAFEGLVHLKMLREDPEFVERHERAQEVFRRNSLADIDEGRVELDLTEEEIDDLRRELEATRERIDAEDIKQLKLSELVRDADALEAARLGDDRGKARPLTHAYRTLYQLGNLPTHSNVKAVEPYLRAMTAGVDHLVDLDDVRLVVINATGTLVMMSGIASEIFDQIEFPEETGDVVDRFEAVRAAFDAG